MSLCLSKQEHRGQDAEIPEDSMEEVKQLVWGTQERCQLLQGKSQEPGRPWSQRSSVTMQVGKAQGETQTPHLLHPIINLSSPPPLSLQQLTRIEHAFCARRYSKYFVNISLNPPGSPVRLAPPLFSFYRGDADAPRDAVTSPGDLVRSLCIFQATAFHHSRCPDSRLGQVPATLEGQVGCWTWRSKWGRKGQSDCGSGAL